MTAVLAHGFEANLSNRRLTLANLQGRSIEYVDSADHALTRVRRRAGYPDRSREPLTPTRWCRAACS